MKILKNNIFKIIVSCMFSVAALTLYLVYWLLEDANHGVLAYSSIVLSFVFSLLFVRLTAKKMFFTCALAVNCLADYFLILNLNKTNQILGLVSFCVVQLFYFVYTCVIIKKVSMKIVAISVRVVLSMLAGFLVPVFFKVGAVEILSVIYILNSFLTLVTFAFYMKNEWLTFIGFLLFFICDIFVGLSSGAEQVLGLSEQVMNLLSQYHWAYFFYTPGIFLIALSSVWEFDRGRVYLTKTKMKK